MNEVNGVDIRGNRRAPPLRSVRLGQFCDVWSRRRETRLVNEVNGVVRSAPFASASFAMFGAAGEKLG